MVKKEKEKKKKKRKKELWKPVIISVTSRYTLITLLYPALLAVLSVF